MITELSSEAGRTNCVDLCWTHRVICVELLDTITQIQIFFLGNFKTLGGGFKKTKKLSNIKK